MAEKKRVRAKGQSNPRLNPGVYLDHTHMSNLINTSDRSAFAFEMANISLSGLREELYWGLSNDILALGGSRQDSEYGGLRW